MAYTLNMNKLIKNEELTKGLLFIGLGVALFALIFLA